MKYDQEYYRKKSEGSMQSGNAAEEAVKSIFGLTEPFVEVKACCHEYYRVVIKVGQLERWIEADKTYVICVYHRRREGTKWCGWKKNKYTMAEAFVRPLRFYFIKAAELKKIIEDEGLQMKSVTGGSGMEHLYDYYLVRWTTIQKRLDGPYDLLNNGVLHQLWGDAPEPPNYDTPPPF